MQELLRMHGLEVTLAADEAQASEALQRAQTLRKPITQLICDIRLAHGSDGLRIGQALARRFAPLQLLLVTGETAPERLQRVKDAGIPVLFKPVNADKLLAALNLTAT